MSRWKEMSTEHPSGRGHRNGLQAKYWVSQTCWLGQLPYTHWAVWPSHLTERSAAKLRALCSRLCQVSSILASRLWPKTPGSTLRNEWRETRVLCGRLKPLCCVRIEPLLLALYGRNFEMARQIWSSDTLLKFHCVLCPLRNVSRQGCNSEFHISPYSPSYWLSWSQENAISAYSRATLIPSCTTVALLLLVRGPSSSFPKRCQLVALSHISSPIPNSESPTSHLVSLILVSFVKPSFFAPLVISGNCFLEVMGPKMKKEQWVKSADGENAEVCLNRGSAATEIS